MENPEKILGKNLRWEEELEEKVIINAKKAIDECLSRNQSELETIFRGIKE